MKNNANGDLIKFIYDEMSSLEEKTYKNKLENDPELKEECRSLNNIRMNLDSISYSPCEHTLDRIMKYAKSPKPVEQSR
jgi:hypothetical protein